MEMKSIVMVILSVLIGIVLLLVIWSLKNALW